MAAKKHYCGFCGKAQDEVEKLLAGPCIEVCNECVDMMHKLVHQPMPLLPVKLATKKVVTVISFQDAARKHRARSCVTATTSHKPPQQ